MPFLPAWASEGPLLIVFLFCVVLTRSQGTYWLGRAAAAGALTGKGHTGWRGALAAWFDGPVPRKGERILSKWGIAAVPLTFLTPGIHSAVVSAAGLVRLRWSLFTLISLPGCIAWAVLYGLGLLAVWLTFWRAVAGSPLAWVVLTVGLLSLVFFVFRRHRRRHHQ